MKRKFYTDIRSLVQKSTISGPLDQIIDNLHDILVVFVGRPDFVNRNGEAILSRIISLNEVTKLPPGEVAATRLGPVQRRLVAQTPRRISREFVILCTTGCAQEAGQCA